MHHAFTLADFAVIYSPAFLTHDTGSFHPENAGRLKAIVAALETVTWVDHLDWREPTPVKQRQDVDALIAQLHNPRYVTALREIAHTGGGHIDGDTVVSEESYAVARLAVMPPPLTLWPTSTYSPRTTACSLSAASASLTKFCLASKAATTTMPSVSRC